MDKTKLYTVDVPRKFEPLILAEMQRLGVDTITACLAHVLQGYFDATQLNEVEQPKPDSSKELSVENSGSNVPQLQAEGDSGSTARDADSRS